jgi:hypothetical protein
VIPLRLSVRASMAVSVIAQIVQLKYSTNFVLVK